DLALAEDVGVQRVALRGVAAAAARAEPGRAGAAGDTDPAGVPHAAVAERGPLRVDVVRAGAMAGRAVLGGVRDARRGERLALVVGVPRPGVRARVLRAVTALALDVGEPGDLRRGGDQVVPAGPAHDRHRPAGRAGGVIEAVAGDALVVTDG